MIEFLLNTVPTAVLIVVVLAMRDRKARRRFAETIKKSSE